MFAINNVEISDLEGLNIDWQDMAGDEHNLSYLSDNIDGINMVSRGIWSEAFDLDANQASNENGGTSDNNDFAFIMDDRDAKQMRLDLGDRVEFNLLRTL